MTYDNTRSSLVSRALSFLLRSDPGTRHPARWVKENNTAMVFRRGGGCHVIFFFPTPGARFLLLLVQKAQITDVRLFPK